MASSQETSTGFKVVVDALGASIGAIVANVVETTIPGSEAVYPVPNTPRELAFTAVGVIAGAVTIHKIFSRGGRF